MTWTTPADLVSQVTRLWTRGRILCAIVSGEPLFPRRLLFRRPDRRAMAERFGDVREWIRALENGSKAKRGFGYEIDWTEINHRQLGRNRIPGAIIIPGERDALRLIGKEKAASRFCTLAQATMDAFPTLKGWLARRPLTLLEHADDWPRVLAVVAWFKNHPRSGLYLRQVDIPGVDTKFIEARKSLLSELIGLARGDGSEEQLSGARSFELRHGLRAKPALVRFRILDARLAIGGMTDLTVPVMEFANLGISPARVFVTENETNGLSFPDVTGSIVIFGLGYGAELLSDVPWLGDREIHYWGDIDTHGFAMLDRVRRNHPQAQAFLMDRSTLLAHRTLWGVEPSPYVGELTCLPDEERALYDDLCSDRLGNRVRLEQEHVRFGRLEQTLRGIGAPRTSADDHRWSPKTLGDGG
ncbi:MAG: hypothetical protein GY798_34710 [Hyphomicrobiales bacterium]|nr:hypothetical protein [Hyphomicrobiales bacterium]